MTRRCHQAHEQAAVAFLQLGSSDVLVSRRWVNPLARLNSLPSLDADSLILQCLCQLSQDDPEAVLEHLEAIADRVTLEPDDVTKAVTGCCVELVKTDPMALVHLAPMLSVRLDIDDKANRKNSTFVLTNVAAEYPEEVRPLVPQVSGTRISQLAIVTGEFLRVCDIQLQQYLRRATRFS